MAKKITKAVIPAAGLGTRFLPITKTVPKEMLPIIDKPAIQYVIEEAVLSGISDILLITSLKKDMILEYFNSSLGLEAVLKRNNKHDEIIEIKNLSQLANIYSINQNEALGLGHAIYLAKDFVGDDDFACLLPDDIIQSNTPALAQLIDVYYRTNSTIIGTQEVELEDVSKYGILDITAAKDDYYIVKDIIEKPHIKEAPSQIAAVGRYILNNHIFDLLEKQQPGHGGEIQLTDSLRKLIKIQTVYAVKFQGKRYDLGSKVGFLEANLNFALSRDDLRDETLELIKTINKKECLN